MTKKSDKDPTAPPKEIDRVKSSVFSRSLALARIGFGASAQMAGRSVAQIWENKELRDENWKLFFAKQAKNFAGEIGELKGSLMKAGQMLSMYGEHFFPPEVNQFLKSLQNDSPPVKWEAIREILVKQLGEEKLALLEIESKSTASASLGQVHKAKVKATGEVLALKVQYPGVDIAIDSDLKAIKAFLGLMQVLPKDFDTGPLFDEVRKMLIQETDYRLEADWTDRYAAELQGDDRYIVPKVNREFSNQRVLATSFEVGVRPDDPLVQALSQERRDRLAESFMDLYFRELFQSRLVQTDPHPGNYRVRLRSDGKDQMVLLDFGATKEYSEEFMGPYRHMIGACVREDRPAFRKAAIELGLLRENDPDQLMGVLEKFCFMIVEPFRADTYDWKNTDLPQRISKITFEMIRAFSWRSPPEEILFLDRKTGGVFIMMGVLRSKISGRQLILKALEGDGQK